MVTTRVEWKEPESEAMIPTESMTALRTELDQKKAYWMGPVKEARN